MPQKCCFRPKNWHFLGKKCGFVGEGGSETLDHLLQNPAKHASLSPASSKKVWGPTSDHSGPKNTVLGQKMAFFGHKMRFFGDGGPGSGTHGQHRRHTTTEVVPRVGSDHKDPSGYPRLPKAAGWGRVPTGLFLGAPCPYPRRESRVVKPHELLHKGSGIKAIFSLAPLPRRPCMGESPCSLGGGVDSSNHQFPRQTD